MTPIAYQLMVERILEDSFPPRNKMDFTQVIKDLAQAELENMDAEKECAEHFTYLDSAEYAIQRGLPF